VTSSNSLNCPNKNNKNNKNGKENVCSPSFKNVNDNVNVRTVREDVVVLKRFLPIPTIPGTIMQALWSLSFAIPK
jgi:hypothetical protein